MASDEINLRIWKKPEDDETEALFTVSAGKRTICVDMPINRALASLREFLERDE